jgi:cbb3-type cytochrome oxidase subunit 3
MLDYYTELCGLLVGSWGLGFASGFFIAVVYSAIRLISYR